LAPGCLEGEVVVITGAGRGIGREMARGFAHWGASVVLAELSDQGADTERVIQSQGGRALFIRTDVADAERPSAQPACLSTTQSSARLRLCWKWTWLFGIE
jgi:NAD(P)-dependent dehydrogenase (short-subunit alcohol dehydrogenase family)